MAEGRLFLPFQGLEITGLKPKARCCGVTAMHQPQGRGGPHHCLGGQDEWVTVREALGAPQTIRQAGRKGSPHPLGAPLLVFPTGWLCELGESPPTSPLISGLQTASHMSDEALRGGQGGSSVTPRSYFC